MHRRTLLTKQELVHGHRISSKLTYHTNPNKVRLAPRTSAPPRRPGPNAAHTIASLRARGS